MVRRFDTAMMFLQVTPAGYSQMADMLYTLSGGKLLVILEGGFVY